MTGALASRLCSASATLVCGLAFAATLAVLVPVPGPARAVAVVAFVLVGPGATVAHLLPVRDAASWVMVTVAGSLAVGVLGSELAAILHGWAPRALLLGLAVLCAGVVLGRDPAGLAPRGSANAPKSV